MKGYAFVAIALLAALDAPAHAEPPGERDWLAEYLTHIEMFNEDAVETSALRDALRPNKDSPWTASMVGGDFVLENRTDSSSLRYIQLASLLFGVSQGPSDGARPTARIRADDATGGAGLMAGYAVTGGDYLAFTVIEGRYAVFERRDGRLSRLENGRSAAIVTDGVNEVALDQDSGRFVFLVNGEAVATIERPELRDAPVGVAAIGKGRFTFEDIAVRPAPAVIDRIVSEFDTCDVPRPADGDATVLLSAYDGVSTSTVTVDGQDQATQTIRVEVVAGEGAIYLMATSHEPVIWRLGGATERVSHFSVIGRQRAEGEGTAGGVVGLPSTRVSFTHEGCPSMPSNMREEKRAWLRASLALGRPVDTVLQHYDPSGFVVPDGPVAELGYGKVPPKVTGPVQKAILHQAMRFRPGGLVEIDPASVVADGPVERYEVLPQEWGLLQLVADGTLMFEEGGFRITRATRFPAELAGAHSVSFLLPEGVPYPAGNRGHSKVLEVPALAAEATSD